tara:strand:+ start:1522 stop:1701 length:180 start_codon:yes stop_codon:yes gene_type:complete
VRAPQLEHAALDDLLASARAVGGLRDEVCRQDARDGDVAHDDDGGARACSIMRMTSSAG